ncbi:hypothetical protein PV08_10363 [Exophiala spinifera]|uniref:AA1-like domain-containing protein n=1 Tax=Exophiala spinifera TaxID=91928 RepID=A0A0D2BI88_9EURO|nr:uncharacterized protein PV08_10363 [Exophiala spinifera]KIW11064.1 hypothetical protein PV08_10363 [Exophiala spinifera]
MLFKVSLGLAVLLVVPLATAFSGNFEVTNIVVSSPSQANPNSTEGSFVEFEFSDQDTPEAGSTHCCIEWAAGTQPSTTYSNTCHNSTFNAQIKLWEGVDNVTLQLSHRYIDNSVGKYPYNILTKFSNFFLSYPSIQRYNCDTSKAECESSGVLIAIVSSAVA